jgi:hypothetical protein
LDYKYWRARSLGARANDASDHRPVFAYSRKARQVNPVILQIRALSQRVQGGAVIIVDCRTPLDALVSLVARVSCQ